MPSNLPPNRRGVRSFYKRWSSLATATIAALIGGLSLYGAYSLTSGSLATSSINTTTPPGRLTAIAQLALQNSPPNYDRAEQSLILLLNRQPENAAAWNQLAFIDAARLGQPSRDGLIALLKSYQVSPYGDLEMMIWRVSFASHYWPAIPTDLRDKTLSQLAVIEKFGASWPWRVEQCKTNPHPTLARAICAISPGVVRPNSLPR